MERPCRRCERLPHVPEEPKQVLLIFPVEAVKEKVKELLRSRGQEFQESSDLIGVVTDDFKEFLKELRGADVLSSVELQDISCIALDVDAPLNVSDFRYVKSLATWFSLLDAEDFLELLSEGRLTMYFQPIVDAKSLSVVGFEMLARGVNRDGSVVPPNVLFETARKTDTLFYLDRACRETAVKLAAVKRLDGYLIFVNFTPTSIYDPQFCLKSTLEWAQQLNYDPSRLVFEVVESEKVEDVKHLSNVLNFYKSNGFKVALDDVGTGYSTLSVLIDLKPDIIKIDRELISEIDKNNVKQAVFDALVEVAKRTGIQTLAEGVETREEFEWIRDKVDLAQGFLFGKPSPEPVRTVRP